jgi:phosphomannomutase
MSKNKIQLDASTNVDMILEKIADKFKNEKVTTIDGVKIDFEEGWVHLRKSNTEPIIRVYSEGKTEAEAERLAQIMLEEAMKN